MTARLPKQNKTISEPLKIIQETKEKIYSWDMQDGRLPVMQDMLNWMTLGTMHRRKSNTTIH